MMSKSTSSFADGWKVFYQARTLFTILLILAMAVNIAIFIVAGYTNLLKPILTPAANAPLCRLSLLGRSPASAPASMPVAGGMINKYSPEQVARAQRWSDAFSSIMTLTAIIALVSAIFLLFCALVGLMMIIAGQLPGAGSICGAFFWAVGIIVLLLPWSNMLSGTVMLPLGIAGFSSLKSSLMTVSGQSVSWFAYVPLWFKFVIYPILIILFAIMYFGRTGQSNLQIMASQTGSGESTSV